MPSIPDVQDGAVVYYWAAIVVFGGGVCQALPAVQGSKAAGSCLNAGAPSGHFVPEGTKELVLQVLLALLVREDFILPLFQLPGLIAFTVDQCLFADKPGGNQVQMGAGYLDIVTKTLLKPIFNDFIPSLPAVSPHTSGSVTAAGANCRISSNSWEYPGE